MRPKNVLQWIEPQRSGVAFKTPISGVVAPVEIEKPGHSRFSIAPKPDTMTAAPPGTAHHPRL
jgi:hypothetical protein